MDIEIGAEAKDKAFNRRVAITVVALSIFMGFCGVKDGNICLLYTSPSPRD